jgi:hypothetical protein
LAESGHQIDGGGSEMLYVNKIPNLNRSLNQANVLLIALVIGICSAGAYADEFYISTNAREGGSGSLANPFSSLAQAESASEAGDTIYLLATGPQNIFDGGIRLKPDQKLLGSDASGNQLLTTSTAVRITNTSSNLDGSIIQLSSGNEVAGIHFTNLRNSGIVAGDQNISETNLHHNTFTGSIETEDIIWSISLESSIGSAESIRITDSIFENGVDMGGIRVLHTNDSTGDYQFERNSFMDLGGRAYIIQTMQNSNVKSIILDSSADNIGHGGRNSDSILPYLQGSSEQTMVVRGFQYNNSKQVGSVSNTGMEAFIMGAPFPDEENWCDGCKLDLTIEDSVFENTVTDGMQFTNYGSNSTFDIKVRNVRVINANPQQVGGAISLIAENPQNSGNRNTLLIENSDMINSTGYGLVVLDLNAGYTSIVDLGGGELGSVGNNRIINSTKGDVQINQANPVARNNWWGGGDPRVETLGVTSSFDWLPALTESPRN